jgi:PAS domain S-box-containing protein
MAALQILAIPQYHCGLRLAMESIPLLSFVPLFLTHDTRPVSCGLMGAYAVIHMSTQPLFTPATDVPPLRPDAILMRLFEVSPDPITVTAFDSGELQMCNEAFCRLTGYSSDELKDKSATDLGLWNPPQERDRYVKMACAPGGVQGFSASFTAKGGRRVPVLISASVFEQDGRRYLLAVLHDISERERRRLQYEAVLSNAMVGIATTRDRIFQLSNARYEEMLGWAPGTLIGMPGSVVWPSTHAYEEIGAIAGPLLGKGEPIDLERELARRDGSVFWARIRARAVDPKNPRDSGTIWIIEDVTDRRRNQQALAAAKELAEAANLAKSQFLANTSHEIRTPLNGLLGLVHLALSETEPPHSAEQLKHYLIRIQESAQTLADIISDILDFSKIEAGQLRLELRVFDLHQMLQEVCGPYEELSRAQRLAFRLNLASNLPRWVRGDALRLRQILGNYLSNALKFSERGLIDVNVVCAGPGRVRFEVTDQGVGIEARALDRLFKPFSQADGSTTRRFGGTGLGLSICRQLAQLMGGEVGVRSQPDQGSTFWLDVPLPAVSVQPDSGEETSTGDHDPRESLRGSRVLVVEDNPVNTLVVEAMLRQWGVDVTVAEHGAQGIAVVEGAEHPFDAVLMDLQMPVMGGFDATRALRIHLDLEQLPVIALTAGVLMSEREEALTIGMNDFLTKPIEPDQLAQVLAHWVSRARAWRNR